VSRGEGLVIVKVCEEVNNAATQLNKQKTRREYKIVKNRGARRITIPLHNKVVGVRKLKIGVAREKPHRPNFFSLTLIS